MEIPPKITFVVAANSDDVLEKNLLISPCLQRTQPHQLIVQKGFTSAARAFNEALIGCVNDLLVIVHQDIFLPDPWLSRLQLALENLSKNDPSWGVLGCWGVKEGGKGFATHSTGLTFKNNIIAGQYVSIVIKSGATFASGGIDYNTYGNNTVACGGYSHTFSIAGVYDGNTLSGWQSVVPVGGGEDLHSQQGRNAQLALNSDLSLGAGSVAKAAGTNLNSTCNGQPNPGLGALCYDKNGVARPSSGAWDAGA